MTIEKYAKVELSLKERRALNGASDIIDELRNVINDDEYPINFELISKGLRDIAYVGSFEISTQE